MSKFYNPEVDIRDPLAQVKRINIESLRYVSNETGNLKGNMYSKIYYSFSLIFTVFITIFAQSLNWVMVFLFIDLLLIGLILFAKIFYNQRKENAKISRSIIKKLNNLGMNISE